MTETLEEILNIDDVREFIKKCEKKKRACRGSVKVFDPIQPKTNGRQETCHVE